MDAHIYGTGKQIEKGKKTESLARSLASWTAL
jgi:hypothetical protein